MEACMLVCEAAIFTCSILMVLWNMASNRGMVGYEDMAVYTVLCSISTLFAITVTLSLLLVPTHVRSCTTLHNCHCPCQTHSKTVMLSKILPFLLSIGWSL
jgi:hypothetical protein